MSRDSAPGVAIVGAGIGGLTASLLLARAGIRVTLIEKRPGVEEHGAGLQLSPNASRVLVDAGLGPALLRSAGIPERVRIRRRSGGEIATIPLGEHAAKRYGAPYLMVHRADLARLLDEAVRREERIDLAYGCEALAAAQREGGSGIALALSEESGQSRKLEAAALIAADGVWGKLAALPPPRFSGFVAWRGLADARAAPTFAKANEVGLWLGPGAHLVHYPIRGGGAVNIVAVTEERDPQEGWSRRAEGGKLAAAFARWDGAARDLIAAVPDWRIWSLFDRDPLRRWGEGPMTFLGDAAHPMLPFLAQGAAMAIEDAATLAAELAPIMTAEFSSAGGEAHLTAALRRYEQARFARTARVQREARRNAFAYHAPWPAGIARDLVLRASSAKGLLARYDWLYGWRPKPMASDAPPSWPTSQPR